ncbi:MAG: VirB8/TrbF family protein [Erythrobacter sp.]
MTVQPDHDLADLPVAESWATSVTDDLERSNRRAWIVAIIAALIALLEALALVFLVPLKTVEPYTLLVDRQTGNVEALAPLNASIIQPDDALTRSMVVQYVIARESFASEAVQDDYRKVLLWSDSKVGPEYQRAMAAANAQSPLSYLPRGSTIRTEVKSVSQLREGRYQVRFATTVSNVQGRTAPAQHWIAIVDYAFSEAQMSEADRYVNPLGFQVTFYRRNPETIVEESAVDPAAQTAGSGEAQ